MNCIRQFLYAIIIAILSVTLSKADTITLNWLNEDGTVSQLTTCQSGGDVILPPPPTKHGYTFVGWRKNYTPIEYLESTGTQYIDTEINGDNDDLEIVTTFSLTETPSEWVALFGNYEEENYNSWRLPISTQKTGWVNSNTQSSQGQIGYSFNVDYIYNFDLKYQSLTINNVTTSFSAPKGVTNNNTILIFTGHKNLTYITAKIYSFKIYDNNVLVRDMIPVIDINNVPCMFDKVESKFYYNQGTGNFIAGPVISE